MRNRYFVCYDVADAKRLHQTFKKMNGFGDPVQYSVFVCDLSPKERILLVEALTDILNLGEDRVMIIDAGPAKGRGEQCFEVLGKASVPGGRNAVIV